MKHKFRTLLLLIVIVALSTGGSFTCYASSGDGHPTTRGF